MQAAAASSLLGRNRAGDGSEVAGFAAERIGLQSTVLAFGGTLVVVSLLGWNSRALREA